MRMMQIQLTVEGATYVDLLNRMEQVLDDFLAGAPEGTTSEVTQINPAEPVQSVPEGFGPIYRLTQVYTVTSPNDDDEHDD